MVWWGGRSDRNNLATGWNDLIFSLGEMRKEVSCVGIGCVKDLVALRVRFFVSRSEREEKGKRKLTRRSLLLKF